MSIIALGFVPKDRREITASVEHTDQSNAIFNRAVEKNVFVRPDRELSETLAQIVTLYPNVGQPRDLVRYEIDLVNGAISRIQIVCSNVIPDVIEIPLSRRCQIDLTHWDRLC